MHTFGTVPRSFIEPARGAPLPASGCASSRCASLSLSIYIYIYVYMICTHIYIYIYIHYIFV